MKYKDFIREQMNILAKRPEVIFLGYNLKCGSRAYGTLADVPPEKIIEMPTAEASMVGIATGLALTGFLPVVFFERHDFLLLASDQIINHLSKIAKLSHGDFNPKVIIRAVIGHDKPFNPGPQHMGNYAEFFSEHISAGWKYNRYDGYGDVKWIKSQYPEALSCKGPYMIIEERSRWEEEVA